MMDLRTFSYRKQNNVKHSYFVVVATELACHSLASAVEVEIQNLARMSFLCESRLSRSRHSNTMY